MMLMMMDSSSAPCFNNIIRESKNGIMDDEPHGLLVVDDVDDNDNSEKNSCVSDLSDVSSSAVSSDASDFFEGEVNSTESSFSPSSGSSPTAATATAGPLQDLSSLLQELPFKRGLSKHYNGKSQSFTSLSNVRCLEDLAKPENPYNKRLKSCRSYGGLTLESRHGSSRLISSKKATTRGSCSSLCVRRNPSTGFLGSNRPPSVPPPPHRSSRRSNFTTQTPLFALGV